MGPTPEHAIACQGCGSIDTPEVVVAWWARMADGYTWAIGALRGKPLRMSPEDAIRRLRDS